VFGFHLFSKILEQRATPAGCTFGILHHFLQLPAGNLLFLDVGFLVNETLLLGRISGVEEQDALAW
jgi:hypothetical protein